MNNLINKEKLENLLVAHWTEFINIQELLKYLGHPNKKVQKLTISRFERTNTGFIVWLEFLLDGIETTREILL